MGGIERENLNLGCYGLGGFGVCDVCDKVVLDLDLSSFPKRSLLGLHEISLILLIDRRHGLVADSITVASPHGRLPLTNVERLHADCPYCRLAY